ncbi:MAG: ribosome silencing factor [Bacteroidales bacterium]|nr:ribosome silencing factor [Bacteroidales bacterium]
MTETEPLSTEEQIERIIEALKEKKGKQILTIDLRKIENSICDHFIICHGDSTTQVNALTDSVEKKLKENGNIRAHHVEGLTNCQWVLMDYNAILVHIFLENQRRFYNLEELWADGKIEQIADEM